jgi:hypothetical protein
MTHRLMDGNLLYINKSIKDDKIDYVVMGTEGASDGQSFSGTNTGNVLADMMYRCYVFLMHKFKNRNHRFYDTI